jgi:hypothetical protein
LLPEVSDCGQVFHRIHSQKFPKVEFRAAIQAHPSLEPDKVLSCRKISPPPPVLAKAQIIIARNAGGTMIALAKKSQRTFCGLMRRKGNCISQKRR